MKYKDLSLPKSLSLAEAGTSNLKDFLKHINLSKDKLKKIEAFLQGAFQSSRTGSGFDFNEIREYKIGDDLRHISWNTTAKTGALHTKEYFAEKDLYSYFLVDISNSMFCGNKPEPFVKLLAFLLNTAMGFSERIGGVFFSDEIKHIFPLSHSHSQTNLMFESVINVFDTLRTGEKENLNTHTVTNISSALEFAKRSFSKKGMIFIISDFVNVANWEKLIFENSQKQNIYLFQIYDPLDFNLPKNGYITLIDPETKQRFTVNTDSKVVRENYYTYMLENQKKLKLFLESVKTHHLLIEKRDFV